MMMLSCITMIHMNAREEEDAGRRKVEERLEGIGRVWNFGVNAILREMGGCWGREMGGLWGRGREGVGGCAVR